MKYSAEVRTLETEPNGDIQILTSEILFSGNSEQSTNMKGFFFFFSARLIKALRNICRFRGDISHITLEIETHFNIGVRNLSNPCIKCSMLPLVTHSIQVLVLFST